MGFKRFVEVGRVALVNYGEDCGKLLTILDIVDSNQVLCDGAGFVRKLVPIKRLSLTDHKVKIPRNARQKTLAKAFTKAQVLEKWSKSAWARKLESQKKRAAMTDFDRFKVMIARKARSAHIKKEVAALKKAASKSK